MDRRDFIKQGTGGITGLKTALLWAAVLVVIFLFSKAGSAVNIQFDVFPASGPSEENGSFSFFQFLKNIGIVVACILALFLAAFLFNFLEKKMAEIIPVKIKNWFIANKKWLTLLTSVLMIAGVAVYCIIKGSYGLLIIVLILQFFSFLQYQSATKSNTNQPV